MGKFNTYRYLVLRDAEGTTNGGKKFPRKAKRPAKMQRVFLISTVVAVVVFIGLYTSLLNPVVNRLADTLGYSKPTFAVIIDAGSTGSRVLAYTFHQSFVGGHLILDDELFHEVKPGLSSFVDNPQQGAKSILTLLQKAFTVVPEQYRAATPLLLRATAGLRLLEPVAAERLVDTVRAALVSSGFKVGADSVEIMDGQDEGIYSWFTVNFLQKRLDGQATTTALDLGGGSTQITYEPPTVAALKPLVSVPGAHRNFSLYTYSYLNLGLMAVRRGVLLAQNPEVAKSVESNCINPIIREQSWKYANKEYLVSGSQKDIAYLNVAETQISVADKIPIVQMEVCKNIIYTLVKGLMANIPTPTHLQKQHINAFSYYFDRASEAGLIDPIAGGKVKVSDFMAASERECQSPNVDQPWACLDLTYISILLQEAFKLDPSKELELRKKIDGHEISWALGLAYNTLVKDL